ncbi:MAG TPA: C25 family cysteine peptidase [Thermoanaerobaculia bacterium]|nr:C25 family cysteine peptidase [Thermoanaerobaculia bacterium]
MFKAAVSAVVCGILALASANAQVVFDSASAAAAATVSNANPVTLSWNHTVGAAKKPYVVVSVSFKLNGGAATVGSVTYGSETGGPSSAMTFLGAATNGTTTRAELWGLSNPLPGTHTITVSITNGGAQSLAVAAGAKSFTNVFQSNATAAVVTATGNTTTPTVNVTNSSLSAVVDSVAYNANNALTAGANQTNAYNLRTGVQAFSGAGSMEIAQTNSVMSWTAGAASQWAIAAVALQPSSPQILFDAASSKNFAATTTTFTGSWNHTTTNAANRYLVVAVNIDESGGASTVTGVRYGTEAGGPNVAMGVLGTRANGTNVRTELWGLVAPASGTHQITVTIGNNTGARNTNIVAGAQSFSGVEQPAPTGTFVSASANSATPAVAVTNSAYDYVVDSLAWNSNNTLTANSPQDERFTITTNTAAPVTNFFGGSSGAHGYTNTSMSWTTGAGAQNWAMAAIPLKAATVKLTKVASADVVKLGQAITYTITATNYGAVSATNVTITDPMPSGTVFVSQTGCAGTGPVSCNIGTLAAGATSSPITVTVMATAAGPVANTASVAFSGNATSNVSETTNTVVEGRVCATPGKDGAGGTLAGVVNDYWPGASTIASGATSMTIGARVAGGKGNTIAAGDLLILMQMQDAAFDTTNDETYGEGTGSTRGTGTGSGAATTLNNAGRWEYVVAANSVTAAGGTLQVTGGGASSGTLYSYTSETFATTTTEGQRTWQVVRVPQYTTATLGSTLTALGWNGATGGVLAVDVSGTVTLGGATVSVNGLGFRGGAGRLLNGDATAGLASTDFRTLATQTTNGSKAEGITGTPRYVYQSGATIGAPGVNAALDTGVEGYVGGSYGRGAPGNAGGGSTDGDPVANDDNSGGGGGGNGGSGGAGGFGWNCNCPSGGQGGSGISPSLTRITMGGGGGAGTTNNGSAADATGNVLADGTAAANGYYSSGADGGGAIIIRALQATGTATLTANGANAANVGRDGGGGGGAGGSVLFTTQTGDLSGLTIQAKGGNGGNPWLLQAPGGSPGERHGPGGGGGGGYVLLSSAAASVDVSGGVNGLTTTANDNYGAQPGTAGIMELIAGANVLPGGDGATCAVADLAVTDSAPGTPVDIGDNITFTQTVVNNGPSPADSVVYSTSIPVGATFQSISVPAGWTCITPAVGGTGNITCTRPTLTNVNGVQTFNLVVQDAVGTPNGYLIANTNSVSSLTPDSNTANNTAAASNPTASGLQADMSVTLTNNATTATTAGSNVTFTSVAKNVGASAATGATWSIPIPANMSYQSLTPPAGWTCITPALNATSGTINCSASGTIAAGASVTFTPVFKVLAGTAAGTTIAGTATVGATNDVDPWNNTASSSFVVRGAAGYDMVATMSAAPDPSYPGENVTFTSVVTNNGPASAPATGTGVQWVMSVPSGTNFQSLTPPAGWTCVTPAVGATSGTITCTYSTAFATATTSAFTPVFAVNAATATGTTITGSATVTINGVTTADNVPANNTASDTTLVTASTNADVAIVKSVSPNSIGNGQYTNYTFVITNNGPATATNVNISDTLPAQLVFSSVAYSSNIASCSYNSGTTTLTCSIPSLAVGNTATVTFVAEATTTGTIPNTASITSADQTDPVASNNSSTANLSVFAVTLVKLRKLDAAQSKNDVLVTWQTSYESDNLGFNIYRDIGGVRTQVNKHLIAGSAIGKKVDVQKAGHAYRIHDKLSSSTGFVQYWLEDVDTHGIHTMHGPVSPVAGPVGDTQPDSPSLGGLGAGGAVLASPAGIGFVQPLTVSAPTSQQQKAQLDLAGDSGLKIYVSQEGWYHVARADMIAAGFDPGTNDKKISLYTQGIEQPIDVNNGDVEFYGLPLDTASTGARTYWLRSSDKGAAYRVSKSHDKGTYVLPSPVPFTYDRRERTDYFSALTANGDESNFFGPTITTEPSQQELDTGAIDPSYGGNATLSLVMQGCTSGAHSIDFAINGHDLGTRSMREQERTTWTFTFPQSFLVAGANTLTIQSLGGDEDVSFVVDTQLTYMHLLRADNGVFEASLPGSRSVTVGGFAKGTVRAIDVTNPQQPVELDTTIVADPAGGFAATFTTPAGNADAIYVFDGSSALPAPEMAVNKASSWLSDSKAGADLLIITNSAFTSALSPLVTARQRDGISSDVVDVDDVYDEANFGVRDPQAIRSFIDAAVKSWKHAPKWVLLVGDASFDARNYFGLGAFDFVPTKMVPTVYLKTASDDWFTDFNGDGIADIPVGRIPVRTAGDATTVFSKIAGRGTPSGGWATSATFVYDTAKDFDFGSAARDAAKLLPSSITAQQIASDRNAIGTAMNNGALLTEYVGHGSVELWGEDLFDSNDAAALANGNRLPFVISMTCLNGLFNDLFTTSLAESLLTAPNGGAVAVWASSTLTEPDVQAVMNNELMRQVFVSGRSIGDALVLAKKAVIDQDVRKSWILFGDPSMKLR